MPESLALIDRLRAHGHAAVVSGAGPSVLVLGPRRRDGGCGHRPHPCGVDGTARSEVDAAGAEVLAGTA